MKEKRNVTKVLMNSRKKHNECPLGGLASETFKKFDVDLEKIKNEVTILNFEMVDYEEKNKSSVFGEKESISYLLQFVIYNIEFEAKLLTFGYEAKSEILKLDINCKSPTESKELQYCCNLLQRRRNLNLMFITLISFARYLESRRLVCDLILRRIHNIKIEENKDGGKIVVYSDEKRNIKLGIFWSVECNSEHEVFDKLEIYYKVADLPNRDDIKCKLTQLTEPHLEFNEKYHLWRDLLKCLSDDSLVIIVDNVDAEQSSYAVRPNITNNIKPCTNTEEISIIRHPQLMPNRMKVKKEEPCDDEDDDVAIISSSPIKVLHSESNPLVCIKHPKLLSKNSREASILLSDNDDSEEHLKSLPTCVPQNDEANHIIYIDSLDDKTELSVIKPSSAGLPCTIPSSSSSNTFSTTKPDDLNKTHLALDKSSVLQHSSTDREKLLGDLSASTDKSPRSSPIINLSDIDSESVILLPSDTEERQEIQAVSRLSKSDNSTFSSCSHNRRSVINSSVVSNPLNKCSGYIHLDFSKARNGSRVTDRDLIVPAKKPKIVDDDDLKITGVTYVVPD